MKRPSIIIVLLLGVFTYSYFFTGLFKDKVKMLSKYDFDKGQWFLVKGYYDDSIQYIVNDKTVLNKIKDSWILYKSDDNFATTGGYTVDLYSDSGRVMNMDIINDGWLSKQSKGILYNSDFGTLAYSNLKWLDNFSTKWIKAYRHYREFNNIADKDIFLDSLRKAMKVLVLYDNRSGKTINIECLSYDR